MEASDFDILLDGKLLMMELNGRVFLSGVCRLCGRSDENLLPIFEEIGLEKDFSSKIRTYLPIQIIEGDSLPRKVCSQCASTLVTWHDFSVNCVKIDRKLLEILKYIENNEIEQHSENLACSVQHEVNFKIPSNCEESKSYSQNETVTEMTFASADNDIERWKELSDNPLIHQCSNSEWIESREHENIILYSSTPKTMLYCKCCRATFDTRKELALHLAKEHSVLVCSYENSKNFVHKQEEVHSSRNNSCFNKVGDGKENLPYLNKTKDVKNVPDNTNSNYVNSEQNIGENLQENYSISYSCIPVFPQNNGVMEHLSSHNTSEEEEDSDVSKMQNIVRCDVCKKSFSSKDSYKRHYRIHTGEKPYTCDVCGKQFRDIGGLRRHLRDVHDRTKRFGCDICGDSFASKATRDDHRRIHTGERPFVCNYCGKKFKTKATLFSHSKIHTNDYPFPCSLCTRRFRRKQDLLKHTFLHTGEKPHICEICGKSFRIKSEMSRHKVTHSDDKPFVCDACGLTFKLKRYLQNHKKLHAKIN